jgi:hypothetical protein
LVLSLLDIVARKLDFVGVVLAVQFRKARVQRDDCTLVLVVAATGSGAEQAVGEVLLAGHKKSAHNAVVVAGRNHAAAAAAAVGSELMFAVIVVALVYVSVVGTE